MKNWLLLVLLILMSFSYTAAQQVSYTCPMHPDIHSPKPANCPKCGMKLVKEKPPKATTKPGKKPPVKKKVAKSKTPDTYACPMHPEVQSAKPGTCPKCGMKLEKVTKVANKTGEAEEKEREDSGDNTTHHHHGQVPDTIKVDHQMEMKFIENNEPPKTVRYDLFIRDTIVAFGKKPRYAIAVNGQIPMPTLTFTTGDTAEIHVYNELEEETSLHWHGLMLPNQYDGVPNLTQMPIKPHTKHVYRFPIIQDGTHWYHSHSGLQEQIGMYGLFIMHKRKEWDIPTIPVIISEWADMKPKEIQRSLHSATDWFAIKKKSTQSYSEAIKQGHFKTKLANEWKRMTAMDVSDVYYDNFLLNGKNQQTYSSFRAGDKVRLRIANGGASDYFWLTYAGGKITVVASDGNDVEPVEVDRLIIAVSETYDVVVTVPEDKSYEFLVTPEDRTKSASIWLGSGEKVPAKKLERLKYFAGMKMMNDMMAMNGDMKPMGMKMSNQIMDMNMAMYPEMMSNGKEIDSSTKHMPDHARHNMSKPDSGAMNHMNHGNMNMDNTMQDMVTLNYTMLKAPEKTTLPDGPVKELRFDLTGNMNRYVWSLDNIVVSEADRILIKKGENVRVVLFNNSMMRHPMHLHGHDFRLLNGQGAYAPLKNIIDIMPMETDTLEFAANTYGDWFFHCHILYHMMSGMGRIFRYENSPANPEIPDPKLAQRKLFADDRMFHFMARVGFESNGSDGEAMLNNTRWRANTIWHLGLHDMHGYESETMIGRFLGKMQWWFPYIGFDYHYKEEGGPKNIFGKEDKNWFGQTSNKLNRKTIIAGIAYTLPTLTIADFRVDGNGKFRLQLSREDIPLTPRLRFAWMLNTDKEYMAGFRYVATKYFSLSTHYDSDMGLGAGITFTY